MRCDLYETTADLDTPIALGVDKKTATTMLASNILSKLEQGGTRTFEITDCETYEVLGRMTFTAKR